MIFSFFYNFERKTLKLLGFRMSGIKFFFTLCSKNSWLFLGEPLEFFISSCFHFFMFSFFMFSFLLVFISSYFCFFLFSFLLVFISPGIFIDDSIYLLHHFFNVCVVKTSATNFIFTIRKFFTLHSFPAFIKASLGLAVLP